jgi:DNA-binding NarL/FixJ family response regulator
VTTCPQFLVIDMHSESRELLVRTLRRKFPGAVVHESEDAAKAIEIARACDLRAIVAHRTFDMSGAELVRALRDADPNGVIVMVSGIDREEAANLAGANAFLPYDAWLRLGSLLESLISRNSGEQQQQPEVA